MQGVESGISLLNWILDVDVTLWLVCVQLYLEAEMMLVKEGWRRLQGGGWLLFLAGSVNPLISTQRAQKRLSSKFEC